MKREFEPLNLTALASATRRAGQNAVETGNTYAVVGLDDDVWECHMPHAVPESWIDSDEYRAFDGRLISLHHPDGTSEEY